jgi:RNA polymerase sigma factor (sigma-70 family)
MFFLKKMQPLKNWAVIHFGTNLKLEIQIDIHQKLIEASIAGDNRARKQLYDNYSRAMFNICYRMMNNREDAEDMLQEAFVLAFSKLHTFRFDSTFGAWLKRIVINTCINAVNKRKIDLMLTDDLYHFRHVPDEPEEQELPLTPDDVRKAMQQLPDGGRIIFSLYLLEGYDHVEIAEILGITESTSKSQFMRAKRRVYEILKEKYYEKV